MTSIEADRDDTADPVPDRVPEPVPDRQPAAVRAVPNWSDFESFYRAEHGVLERALIMAIGDIEMGRDATAEGFARALQRWGKVSRYESPSGWVYQVGLNWSHSRRRRIRRDTIRPVHMTTDRAGEAIVGGLSGEVTAALLRLSPTQREIVVARFVLDWSESEVAATFDIPLGTAKSRSSRALARLAELLEEHSD